MKTSMAEKVASRIRDAIVDGSFELGERLSEESLSEALGVSRTPVREALRQLRSEGLVEIVPKSGTYIFRPDLAQIQELCACRIGLETAALELVLEGDTDGLVRELTAISAAMEEQLDADDLLSYNRLDADFHLCFFRHGDNRYLTAAYRLIDAPVSALRVHLSARTAGALETSMREHEAMIRAIADGDLDTLRTLVRRHVERAEESATSTLSRRLLSAGRSRQELLRDKLAARPARSTAG